METGSEIVGIIGGLVEEELAEALGLTGEDLGIMLVDDILRVRESASVRRDGGLAGRGGMLIGEGKAGALPLAVEY